MSGPPTYTAQDHRLMARALSLAARGRYSSHPNPRVGCVLVAGDETVGEGWHRRTGDAHAEIEALRAAGARAAGATAYVTLEPCSHHGRTPPCTEALIEAGIGRVVAAMEDPNPRVAGSGVAALRAAGLDVRVGLMSAAANELNAGYVSRMLRDRPKVTLKLAASIDGRTAMASGESKWITGSAARADVQHLRGASSAILTGVGTVIADDPSLTVRADDVDTAGRQPWRVVLDTRLRMPPDSAMLSCPGRTLVFTAETGDAGGALRDAGAEIEVVPARDGCLDLARVTKRLAALECNELMVEAGPKLAGALCAAGLVDELVLYLAPQLMGAGARGMFELPGLERMADKVQLRFVDVRRVGQDLRVRASVAKPETVSGDAVCSRAS